MDSKDSRLSNKEANLSKIEFNFRTTMESLETQDGHLAMAMNEQSSWPLPNNIEDDDIWDFEIVPSRFEEKLSGLILVEYKDNELVIEEEPILKKMQVEEKNQGIKVENVLVGVEKFNFPINFMTWSME